MKPTSTWHTRKWYKQNFGVDPLKLPQLPYKEVPNPYYSTAAAPMKLWKESIVLPYRSQRGIEEYTRRSGRGKKAAATRKKNLMELFSFFKQNDTTVQQILRRLWEIHNSIHELHEKKATCRGEGEGEGGEDDDDDGLSREMYWEYGIEHCKRCEQWSRTQDMLRQERAELFFNLEKITGMEKRSIQLARKYLREGRSGQASSGEERTQSPPSSPSTQQQLPDK